MPWNGKTTISDAKNRVGQFDHDRRFNSIASGRVIPQIDSMKLGEAKEFGLAVMHVDMNNFKKLSGGLSNEKKLRLLNIYLSELTHVIRDYSGFIEKYVGDGITSLFGVGKNNEQAVTDAVHCGLTILTEIYYTINGYLKSIGLPMFSCSIGIDYGKIWVARVGVQGMNQLTLVGNEVSIAKQLEEFAGDHQIFLGGDAYAGLSQREQAFCKKQPDRGDFNWRVNGKRYSFYRYAAYWDGYEL
ncbi:MAG: adenylate/guanylate cyclase domain-containing protein [Thaumarchaeota archaeon]|nr:adenylate/guanylate cyclase domain-containing protein [Nitrososphaerota archaeon]